MAPRSTDRRRTARSDTGPRGAASGPRSSVGAAPRGPRPLMATRSGAGGLEQLDVVPGRVLDGTCWPPGPVTMSLRNVTPAARSRATSAVMSATIRCIRFQPPGPGMWRRQPAGSGELSAGSGATRRNLRSPRGTSPGADGSCRPTWFSRRSAGRSGQSVLALDDEVRTADRARQLRLLPGELELVG